MRGPARPVLRGATGRMLALLTVLLAGCAGYVHAQTGLPTTSGPAARPLLDDRAAPASAGLSPRVASLSAGATRHYEYVFPDGGMFVYDIDHGHRFVQHVSLPGVSGIRGAVASPRTHVLYISHGSDRSFNGSGALLAYDLVRGRSLWDRKYSTGIDSMAISRDGSRIYMPDGELSPNGTWFVLDARTGRSLARITGGLGPHNTVVGLSGRYVYLGGRNTPYLDVASASTGRVVKRVGRLISGVRPFTINGRETLAFTTATGFLGFQVSSLRTGRVLYTRSFRHFGWNPSRYSASAPSHGISLSPDERQVWVIDGPNSYLHVFDVSGLPGRGPRPIADIKLPDPLSGTESPCLYDCGRDGWIQHGLSGCFVYVGDSGDVLSTRSFRVAAFLPALRNTRKHLEIDWRGGVPVATSSRTGLGYVTAGKRPSPSRCR